jgi:hypothetical protein
MTTDPDAQRETARARGRTLLEGPSWDAVADRAALLLTDPPLELDATAAAAPQFGFWLILERDVSRSLPDDLAQPLYRGEPVVRSEDGARVEVMTLEAAQRLVEGVSRASIEARWRVRHAEPVQDRLRLGERLGASAAQLPGGAPERVARTLWLEANAGLNALLALDVTPSLVVAGETRGALERLACFLERGAYPPARYLEAAAAPTALGMRLGNWFTGLIDGVGGDESALRRTALSVDQVREEVRTVVRQRVGVHDWLQHPDAFWLRVR